MKTLTNDIIKKEKITIVPMTTKIITKLKLEGKKEIINTFKTKKESKLKKLLKKNKRSNFSYLQQFNFIKFKIN